MRQIFDKPQIIYNPIFEIMETMCQGLSDIKIDQKIDAILNYAVIENTENYIVLRIDSFYFAPQKRIY